MSTNDHTMTLADIVARIGLANTDHVVTALAYTGSIRETVTVKELARVARDAGMASPTTLARGWTLLSKVAYLAAFPLSDEDGDPIGLPSWETIVRQAAAVYNDALARETFESIDYADLTDMVGTLADLAAEAREASRTRQADAKKKDTPKTPKTGATAPAAKPAPARDASRLIAEAVANLEAACARIQAGDTVSQEAVYAALAVVERVSHAHAEAVAIAS